MDDEILKVEDAAPFSFDHAEQDEEELPADSSPAGSSPDERGRREEISLKRVLSKLSSWQNMGRRAPMPPYMFTRSLVNTGRLYEYLYHDEEEDGEEVLLGEGGDVVGGLRAGEGEDQAQHGAQEKIVQRNDLQGKDHAVSQESIMIGAVRDLSSRLCDATARLALQDPDPSRRRAIAAYSTQKRASERVKGPKFYRTPHCSSRVQAGNNAIKKLGTSLSREQLVRDRQELLNNINKTQRESIRAFLLRGGRGDLSDCVKRGVGGGRGGKKEEDQQRKEFVKPRRKWLAENLQHFFGDSSYPDSTDDGENSDDFVESPSGSWKTVAGAAQQLVPVKSGDFLSEGPGLGGGSFPASAVGRASSSQDSGEDRPLRRRFARRDATRLRRSLDSHVVLTKGTSKLRVEDMREMVAKEETYFLPAEAFTLPSDVSLPIAKVCRRHKFRSRRYLSNSLRLGLLQKRNPGCVYSGLGSLAPQTRCEDHDPQRSSHHSSRQESSSPAVILRPPSEGAALHPIGGTTAKVRKSLDQLLSESVEQNSLLVTIELGSRGPSKNSSLKTSSVAPASQSQSPADQAKYFDKNLASFDDSFHRTIEGEHIYRMMFAGSAADSPLATKNLYALIRNFLVNPGFSVCRRLMDMRRSSNGTSGGQGGHLQHGDHSVDSTSEVITPRPITPTID